VALGVELLDTPVQLLLNIFYKIIPVPEIYNSLVFKATLYKAYNYFLK